MGFQWMDLKNGWRVLTYPGFDWGRPVYHGLVTRFHQFDTDAFGWVEPPDFSRKDRDGYRRRRKRLLQELDAEEWGWIHPRQVHRSRVLWNPDPDVASQFEADGVLTDRAELLLVVTVADCLPIWIWDRELHAVGVLHAGWRGTVAGIAEAAVDMLLAQGSHLRTVDVVIGPGIQKCCFEVGIDVLEAVHQRYGEDARYAVEQRQGRWYVDLAALNILQFRRKGLGRHQIHPIRLCTCCNRPWFFSHRRGDGGRMVAFIGQKERS